MSNLFMTVLNMSLTASYVAIAVIIIRFFLKKAPNILNYKKQPFWIVVTAIIILVVVASAFITNPESEQKEFIRYVSNDNDAHLEFKLINKKKDIAKIDDIMSKVNWTQEIAEPMNGGSFSFWTEKEGFNERFSDYDIWFGSKTIVWDPKTNRYGFIEDKNDAEYLKQIFLDDSTTLDLNHDIDIYNFFETLISAETYKLDIFNDTDKINEIFTKYCNDRGLNILLSNRIAFKNKEFFEENDIQSYMGLKVKLLNESFDENTIFQEYEVSYNYINKNNSIFEFVDYYTINIINNKIDYIYYEQ